MGVLTVTDTFVAGDRVRWHDPDAAPGEWGSEPTASHDHHAPGSVRQIRYGPWEGEPKPGRVHIEFEHGVLNVLDPVDIEALRKRGDWWPPMSMT